MKLSEIPTIISTIELLEILKSCHAQSVTLEEDCWKIFRDKC